MEDTEPFVYLSFLSFAIFFISLGFALMQGSVDATMEFSVTESSAANVGMAKSFYMMNQGESFGSFDAETLQDLKTGDCTLDIPGYVEEDPLYIVDDSCDYYSNNGGEQARLDTLVVVTQGGDSETRTVTTIIPQQILSAEQIIPEGALSGGLRG